MSAEKPKETCVHKFKKGVCVRCQITLPNWIEWRESLKGRK